MDQESSSNTESATEAKANDKEMDSNSIDFTSESVVDGQALTPHIGDKYDPRPQEDGARRTIAYLLIGLLWVIVGGILILLGFGSIKVDNIKDFGVVLSPIIALVSAATGFYYGTKSNSMNER